MQQKVNKLSHKIKLLKQITCCLIASQIYFKDRYSCLHGGAISILMVRILLITILKLSLKTMQWQESIVLMSCCWQRSAPSLPEKMSLPALNYSTTPYHVPLTSPRSFKKEQHSLFKIRLRKNNVLFFTPQAHQHLWRPDASRFTPNPLLDLERKSDEEWRLMEAFVT